MSLANSRYTSPTARAYSGRATMLLIDRNEVERLLDPDAMIDAVERKFREVRIASRNRANAEALAAAVQGARVAASFDEAVRGADVVCLCTDAKEPIVRLDQLSPGCHVTSVGMNAEVGPDLVKGSSVFVEWRGAAATPFPAGAVYVQGLPEASVTELGEVLSHTQPGRRSETEITLYKSTGFAVEDAVTAGLVYARALKEGGGSRISL